MNTILVAIDFSECSLNALANAVSIAQAGNLNIRMIWVNNPGTTKMTIYSDSAKDMVAEITKEFDLLIEKYRPMLGNNTIESVIREGRVYREISDEAKEMGCICIIMGAHGVSGFEHLWIGSNANKLIAVAPCPVITLRTGVNAQKALKRILLPIDSTLDTRQKVPFTIYLAKLFDAEIVLLSIYASVVKGIRNKVNIYSQQVIDYLEEEGVKYEHHTLETTNVTIDTIAFASKQNINLISIMTEQEVSTRNILLGPYAQQMVNTSPIAVLSIKPRDTLVMDSR